MRVLSALVNELAPYKRGQWEVVCLVYQKKYTHTYPHLPHLLVPLSLTSQSTQL